MKFHKIRLNLVGSFTSKNFAESYTYRFSRKQRESNAIFAEY